MLKTTFLFSNGSWWPYLDPRNFAEVGNHWSVYLKYTSADETWYKNSLLVLSNWYQFFLILPSCMASTSSLLVPLTSAYSSISCLLINLVEQYSESPLSIHSAAEINIRRGTYQKLMNTNFSSQEYIHHSYWFLKYCSLFESKELWISAVYTYFQIQNKNSWYMIFTNKKKLAVLE